MLVRVVSVKMAELSSLKCSSSWKATRKLAKNGQNWLFRKSKLAKALQQPGKCMFRKKWLNLAQLVKNPPAMWENWVWSLGLEDPLEKGKATHSGLENSRDYIVHEVTKSWTWLSNFHFHFGLKECCGLFDLWCRPLRFPPYVQLGCFAFLLCLCSLE